jgi:hypothetical protein
VSAYEAERLGHLRVLTAADVDEARRALDADA